jgi:hypothetical protein
MAKGGRESTDATLPGFFETAVQQGIGMGTDASQVGNVVYRGPDVAAFTPMQDAAFQNTQQAAGAFGMNTGAGNYMPQAVEAGGAMGYSAAPVYDQAMQNFQQAAPGQADYIASFGIDPVTGQVGSRAASNQPVSLEMQGGRGGGK